ncbi:MAG TPA: ATP-binding cassette domain-containing protein [Myxococcota bacterium]|nr:ATP-binding cassette domain-containing protein [Myxococcota bacterium]
MPVDMAHGRAPRSEGPPLGQSHVDVVSVRLAFGERRVFDGLSCRFSQAKVSVILGASGVGKSTLLRLIAGLQRPDYGDIWIGEQEITRLPEREMLKVRKRLGMMFQGGALLDSTTVFDNVALPLREHTRMSESEVRERVHAQFEAVGLKRVDDLLPGQLSGGMKKRAALARAMIMDPEILLIDEPFSGLDPLAVRLIEALLVEVNHTKGLTMVLTNHHIGSTMRMADEVVFLVDGAAISGTVKEISQSSDPRIRRFLAAAGSGPALEEAS